MKTFKILISGDKACFTRPEMKAERVSYDVPTPGAIEGLLKSVYWKPAIRYMIDKIIIFNPIEFMSVRRNEVKSKIAYNKMKKQMLESKVDMDNIVTDPRVYVDKERTQRASLILKNVKYGIEFHMEQTGIQCEREKKECNPQVKHEQEFQRRCEKGQWFRMPCLGCSEFPADIKLVEDFELSEVSKENMGEHDLGFMLYKVVFKDKGHPIKNDWNNKMFSDEAESVFYRPKMIDGIIDVQQYRGTKVC
ncbi:MAG: type I-C CRISPR-associated protein Cas5c [Lachnospiraceae bacterium]|jgi:CRISPR-associated protein Cas5d|nr:type I-C CRISPR-associated protein Cas5c [Lachnospiraceae bacterium]MCI1657033.1 type I-C CRISPR-associated protein Cas5c [Lachnospiraceae bacterium]MCI2195542.1 type I-C CRISPR-associated protein Cas5c [Lachnospiraceae bacterium]